MKKYTIKKVKRMEDRYSWLAYNDDADYKTLMGTLSTFAFGMGLVMLSCVTEDSSQAETILAKACAAGCGLGGVGMFIDMITVHLRKVKLNDKLCDIYEKQGEEFRHAVDGLYYHGRRQK